MHFRIVGSLSQSVGPGPLLNLGLKYAPLLVEWARVMRITVTQTKKAMI